MYPNLYYVFKDWFGIQWQWLKILNSFGLFVAIAFIVAAAVLTAELKRREKQGLLTPSEELIEVGKSASIIDLLTNAIVGFIFGAKIFGLIFSRPEGVSPQEYIFSTQGNIYAGLLFAAVLAFVKWYEKDKLKLKVPEKRTIRIWPHDRVGDIVVIALIFGILGAKLFDNFEHWDLFLKDPIGQLFSVSGLTFYGGLILASAAVIFYAYRKNIKIPHLVDSAAACLMIAYAVGRIGCQVSGDGDWGVYNSAYKSDAFGKLSIANKDDFEKTLKANTAFFIDKKVSDRASISLEDVPNRYFKGPSYLPKWFFAYSYPQNVNNEGVPIPGIKEEHFNVLPSPVFPTPLYETILCSLLFLFLWTIRKKIKAPFLMFGVYLILNGIERFLIEIVRVNKHYSIGTSSFSQAQEIAIGLIITGVLLSGFALFKKVSNK